MENKGMVHGIDCTFAPSSIFILSRVHREIENNSPPISLQAIAVHPWNIMSRIMSEEWSVKEWSVGHSLVSESKLSGTNPDFWTPTLYFVGGVN